MLTAARAYVTAGLSVIPIGADKRPFWSRLPQLRDRNRSGQMRGAWKPFRYRRATDAELAAWFGDGQANVGLVGGPISGGLLVLDFDQEAAAIFPAWQERLGALATKMPVVTTRQGVHVYLRTSAAIGNRTLAWTVDGGKRIETRGNGGYVLAPPSRHPSGHVYRWQHGDQTTIPVLTAEAVSAVLAAAAAFDARPQPQSTRARRAETAVAARPGGKDADRLQHYALGALHLEATALAQLPPGGRNDRLNRAAFCLGRYVGAGLLTQEAVAAHLHAACCSNGLIADDGERAFWRTFASGIAAGIACTLHPADLLARLDGLEPPPD